MGYTLQYALLNPNTIPVVGKENISIAPKRAKHTLPALPPPAKRQATATVSKPAQIQCEKPASNPNEHVLLPKNPPNNPKPTVEMFLSEVESSPDLSAVKELDPVPQEKNTDKAMDGELLPEMDLQLMEFLEDTETDELLMCQMETTTTATESHTVQRAFHQKRSSPQLPMPVFNNCKIGNFTINFIKK